MSPLQHASWGPFTKGVIDRAQSSVDLTGAARSLQNWRYTGANRLSIRPGTRVVLTLKDDAGTPATITDVCAAVPFADGCLLVGHSSVTHKAYLYRLNATLDTWTDAAGATHTNAVPQPIGVLWSAIPDCPEVTIAEGLGVGYVAHTAALDGSTLAFATMTFTDSTRVIATLNNDFGDGNGSVPIYFRGVVSFQQHLWGWSFGAGTVASDCFRPEMARFSQPIFATSPAFLALPDSITLGNRVRSLREGIVGGFVAGECLYLGSPYLITRVTGFGRSSWFKQPLDDSYGFVGPKCGVAVGGQLYYWSPRGPMRIDATSAPEPLFDPIQAFVDTVVNSQTIVAGFDSQTDTVFFVCDTGSGVRTFCAFDIRRDVWLGPNNDFGVTFRALGSVAPIYAATVAASLGPVGAPTTASTTGVGATTATGHWVAGDPTSPTQVEIRQQGGSTYTVSATVSAGVALYVFTGLTPNVAYEWRVKHVKDGASSSYLGPVAGSQFTTLTTNDPLAPPTSPAVIASDDDGGHPILYSGHANLNVSWTNSGESGVSTNVEMSNDAGSTYNLQTVASPGASSATVVVAVSGTYLFRMKHTKSLYTDSSYTTPVSVTVSVS